MKYAEKYEQCCLDAPGVLQRWFINLLARKAHALGQKGHKIWSLKYVLETYCSGQTGLRVLDCGAWNGWFLSYDTPALAQRIALDFDDHFAKEMRAEGIEFVLADMEKGAFPFAASSMDMVSMTSTLEHLGRPEHIATEIGRVLRPGGLVFVTVPDIMKYKFRFWDDVTHKRPFNAKSLRFLFETHGFETIILCPYNHNLFIAGNLFPKAIHRVLMCFRGNALMYVGRRVGA